jgi:hypothetical protein
MRQSGAYFGILKRVSITERGAAGHDGPALSVRSWSASLIADMRRSRTGSLDFRLAGPAVRCAPGDVIVARPQGHGSALRNRKGERDLPLLAEFFGHGVDWHAASEVSHRARWHAGTGLGHASLSPDRRRKADLVGLWKM